MRKCVLNIRSTLIGTGMAKICVPIVSRNEEELRASLKAISEAPYDLVEWRADHYEDIHHGCQMDRALKLIRLAIGKKPLLFTFRTSLEGGEGEITDDAYMKLNLEAAQNPEVDLVDIEVFRSRSLAEALIEKIHRTGTFVIGSSHDFEHTPPKDEIVARLLSMQSLGVDITKIAVMPEGERDVLTLMEAALDMKLEKADRPFVTMAMGRLGSLSRAAANLTGSAVTFGAVGKVSAPGQLEADQLKSILEALG